MTWRWAESRGAECSVCRGGQVYSENIAFMESRRQSGNVCAPFSSGQGGAYFENEIQAFFAALMLFKGEIKGFPGCLIEKIKFQTKGDGYRTDDMLVFCREQTTGRERKVLVEITRTVNIVRSDSKFGKVIRNAWSDYRNSALFTPQHDVLMLVVGPMGKRDIAHTLTVLEWAKTTESAEDYFRKVKSNVSCREKERKLEVMRHHVKTANGGKVVAESDLFSFLKHFHIIATDLDGKNSLNFSLITLLIREYSHVDPRQLWARITEVMRESNKSGGDISPQFLEEELADILKLPARGTPYEEVSTSVGAMQAEWTHYEYSKHLAFAGFLGKWNEHGNVQDRAIVAQLVGEDYAKWISGLRRFLNLSNSPVDLQNGQWRVKERKRLWQTHGEYLFDDDLEAFQRCAMEVLKQRDPAFDLSSDQRYAANVHWKMLPHSDSLREGLAGGLALAGTRPEALKNCSENKGERVALLAVRELLDEADPEIWGSLDQLLPDLAEAAPAEFLKAVENGLQKPDCPFDFLFAQETHHILGRPCHTGLLWALEILAWDENYLIKACALLGKLASRDPGGQLDNRPANSLVTIFLPWHPQTTALLDKRKTALKTLAMEVPGEAWKLLINLLPDPNRYSFGTRKPSWRDVIPVTWEETVSPSDYREQVTFYAQHTVLLAENSPKRMSELAQHLDRLAPKARETFLELLSSQPVIRLPEKKKRNIWESLVALTRRHRQFSDEDWALESEIVDKIENVSEMLKPRNLLHLHRNLFDRHDSDHYDRDGDHEEQAKNLEERRQQAVREILDSKDISEVLDFAMSVGKPDRVGNSLGAIVDAEADAQILPALLGSENQMLRRFVCGYVGCRRRVRGWKWLDSLDMSDWKPLQVARLLSFLPFTSRTWRKAFDLLGSSEREYWKITPTYFLEERRHYNIAIDKLNACGRHDAAVDCLCQIHHEGHELDVPRTVQTLLAAASSDESARRLDTYETTHLIKVLQDHPDATIEDLKRVEWAYILRLDGYYRDTSPVTLETQLAVDPSFFCEVIQLLYPLKRDQQPKRQINEKDRAKAKAAWHLFFNWRTPPGSRRDKTFSFDDFNRWLGEVKRICTESGHLEAALVQVGQVLFYCPADPDGAWINRQVAEILNEQDAEKMRRGFRVEAYNSRGAHRVYPDGAPELELAEQYRERAKFLEREGLRRFSETLEELAQRYEREAQQIIDKHREENS